MRISFDHDRSVLLGNRIRIPRVAKLFANQQGRLGDQLVDKSGNTLVDFRTSLYLR